MSGGDSGSTTTYTGTYQGPAFSFEGDQTYWSQFLQDAGLNQQALSEYTTYQNLSAQDKQITRMYMDQSVADRTLQKDQAENFLKSKGFDTKSSYLKDISQRYAEFASARTKQASDRAAYIEASNKAGAGRAGTILTQQINETSKTILGSSGGSPVTILGSK